MVIVGGGETCCPPTVKPRRLRESAKYCESSEKRALVSVVVPSARAARARARLVRLFEPGTRTVARRRWRMGAMRSEGVRVCGSAIKKILFEHLTPLTLRRLQHGTQGIGVAGVDGGSECLELGTEAGEGIEDGGAVGEEDVGHHREVAGGEAGGV